MTTLIEITRSQMKSGLDHLNSPKVFRTSYRAYLLVLTAIVGMVVMIWAPFGLKRTVGLFEEWLTRGASADTLRFLVNGDPTRPFTFAPFVLAQSMIPNSFAGHNLYMMLLFIVKGLIVYKLLYRLIPEDRFLALSTACLFVIYPADTGLMTFRTLNIHTAITCALLSIYWLVVQWQQPRLWRYLGIFALQIFALGIYEVVYGIIFAAPMLLLWQEKRLSRRLIRVTAVWLMLPTVMAIRAAYYIFWRETGYVTNKIQSGTQDNFSMDTALRSLTHMYERHFTAWGYSFDKIDWSSPYLIYAFLSGLLVALVAWQQGQTGETAKSKQAWRRYLPLVIAGLVLMAIGYLPYLPTTFRNHTFRIFYLSSLGAALVLATLIRWGTGLLKQYGRIPATVIIGFLVMLASYNAIGQLAFLVKASDHVQRMMASVLTFAPAVSDDTTILFVDESLEYQDQWYLGGSDLTFFNLMQYVYSDASQNANFCSIGARPRTSYCIFRRDGIAHYGDYGLVRIIPYSQVVIIRDNFHGFELLEEIPEEYLVPGDWEDNLDQYDPHSRIDEDASLPARAETFFTCWPVDECLPPHPNSTPQTEVYLEFDTPMPGQGWQFFYPGISTKWTTSTIATLNLSVAPGTDYRVQIAAAWALDPTILDSLALSVNGTSIPLYRNTSVDGVGARYDGLIHAEVIASNPNNTKLILTTDHLMSSKEAGINDDLTGLGIQFDWLRMIPFDESVRLDFDTAVAGEGWHEPDGSQAWTGSPESTLNIWVNTAQALTAEFRIVYVLSDEIINSLQFSANNVVLPLELRHDEANTSIFRTTIPHEVLATGEPGMVVLKFTTAMTVNPAAMGLSDDDRDLGLLFDWLELRPATEP